MTSNADTRSMFQADMEQLLRKFRDLEADRGARIAKQGNVSAASKAQQVENLKKDNARLKMDLELETRQAKVANTGTAASQIQRMSTQVRTTLALQPKKQLIAHNSRHKLSCVSFPPLSLSTSTRPTNSCARSKSRSSASSK